MSRTCRPSGRGMTASERFGTRCRRLTLERTTSGAVDPRLQVQPKFCLRKGLYAQFPFDTGRLIHNLGLGRGQGDALGYLPAKRNSFRNRLSSLFCHRRDRSADRRAQKFVNNPDFTICLIPDKPRFFATGFVQDTDPIFSVFHPAERLNMIPLVRSSLFSDSQIPWHRLRHELVRHGGQQKARSHCPQPIRPHKALLQNQAALRQAPFPFLEPARPGSGLP